MTKSNLNKNLIQTSLIFKETKFDEKTIVACVQNSYFHEYLKFKEQLKNRRLYLRRVNYTPFIRLLTKTVTYVCEDDYKFSGSLNLLSIVTIAA